jgi:hypothetical protein
MFLHTWCLQKESVAQNMDKAMVSAQQGTFQFNAQRAATPARDRDRTTSHRANAPLATNKPAGAPVSKTNSTPVFKARSMPNFKAIHDKHSKDTASKENTTHDGNQISKSASEHTTGLSITKPNLAAKTAERKVHYVEQHKADKKAEFLAARRSMTPHKGAFGANRATIHPPAQNPFHYVSS